MSQGAQGGQKSAKKNLYAKPGKCDDQTQNKEDIMKLFKKAKVASMVFTQHAAPLQNKIEDPSGQQKLFWLKEGESGNSWKLDSSDAQGIGAS